MSPLRQPPLPEPPAESLLLQPVSLEPVPEQPISAALVALDNARGEPTYASVRLDH